MYFSDQPDNIQEIEEIKKQIAITNLMVLINVKFVNDDDELIISEIGKVPTLDKLTIYNKQIKYVFTYRESEFRSDSIFAFYRGIDFSNKNNDIIYFNNDVLAPQDFLQKIYNYNLDKEFLFIFAHHAIFNVFDMNIHKKLYDIMNNSLLYKDTIKTFDDLSCKYTYKMDNLLSFKLKEYRYNDEHLRITPDANLQIAVFSRKAIGVFTDSAEYGLVGDIMWQYVLSYHGYKVKYIGDIPIFHIMDKKEINLLREKGHLNNWDSKNCKSLYIYLYWVHQYPKEMIRFLFFLLVKDRDERVTEVFEQYVHLLPLEDIKAMLKIVNEDKNLLRIFDLNYVNKFYKNKLIENK